MMVEEEKMAALVYNRVTFAMPSNLHGSKVVNISYLDIVALVVEAGLSEQSVLNHSVDIQHIQYGVRVLYGKENKKSFWQLLVS